MSETPRSVSVVGGLYAASTTVEANQPRQHSWVLTRKYTPASLTAGSVSAKSRTRHTAERDKVGATRGARPEWIHHPTAARVHSGQRLPAGR
ncbi:DUF839 domain-containing protein [Nocardia sp. CT2-14]|uniref:DUF839 domain-containing protein n=1 Tax=Nocardia aurantiaca TaxID=2675850 RepID=A0A6I3KS48_9NOCA|nr:DUF839 domain-containing protein [Nocardia aurantiaca]